MAQLDPTLLTFAYRHFCRYHPPLNVDGILSRLSLWLCMKLHWHHWLDSTTQHCFRKGCRKKNIPGVFREGDDDEMTGCVMSCKRRFQRQFALISHWLCSPFTFCLKLLGTSTEVDTKYVPGTLHNFLPVGDQKERVSQVKSSRAM